MTSLGFFTIIMEITSTMALRRFSFKLVEISAKNCFDQYFSNIHNFLGYWFYIGFWVYQDYHFFKSKKNNCNHALPSENCMYLAYKLDKTKDRNKFVTIYSRSTNNIIIITDFKLCKTQVFSVANSLLLV